MLLLRYNGTKVNVLCLVMLAFPLFNARYNIEWTRGAQFGYEIKLTSFSGFLGVPNKWK